LLIEMYLKRKNEFQDLFLAAPGKSLLIVILIIAYSKEVVRGVSKSLRNIYKAIERWGL